MQNNYQALLDMLKPKEEEPMMSVEPQQPMSVQPQQVVEDIAPAVSTPAVTNMRQEQLDRLKSNNNLDAPESTSINDLINIPSRADNEQEDTQAPQSALERYQALMDQYRGEDQNRLEEARSRDRMLKVGGALGDALATYINAQGQKNVMAPGVQVQQGAGLGKIADMFATSPEIASDVAARREAMLKQYAELARGERAEARAQSQKEIASEKNKIAEERNRLFGQQVAKMGSGREEARQFREEKFEYDKVKNLQDSFNKDTQVVKAEERMASARTMRDFLTENNPIGAEAAKRFAARASGEVGTLTDQDVSVFGGSRAVLDRLQQVTQELATGTLTENNKKFMNQLATTFEKAGQRDLQDRLNVYAKQGTKRTKMSEDEVKETIRPDLVLQQQTSAKKASAGDVVTVKGKKYRVAEDGDSLIPIGK